MDQLSHDQKLILMAMTVTVVAAFVERYSGVKETATVEQIIIGAFIATALLLLLSYVQSEFAVGLAVIAAITMIVAKGNPFWSAIGKVTGTTGKTSITPTVNPPKPMPQ